YLITPPLASRPLAFEPARCVRPQRAGRHERGWVGEEKTAAPEGTAVLVHVGRLSDPRSDHLGDLVERQLDRGLALEERDEDRELAALRLDLADRTGKTGERALLDRDGLADLEVDLGGKRTGDGDAALGRDVLGGRDVLDLDEGLQHVEGLFEAQRRRVVGVAHEAGDAGGVPHDRPGVFRQLHAHQHVTRDAHAGDHLALAVLDLDDVLHRDLDLVDLVLDLERRLALLDVRLDLALEAGVRVDDIPLAGEHAQVHAEGLVRVFLGRRLVLVGLGGGTVVLAVHVGPLVRGHLVGRLGLLLRDLFGHGVVEDLGGGFGLRGLVQVQSVVHDGVRLRVVDVDVDVFRLLLAVLVLDVDRDVLGRGDRELLRGEHVALLGLVLLAGLLCGGRPVGVLRRSPRGSSARDSEHVVRQEPEDVVETVDDAHDDQDEDEHHTRELEKLLAGRGDDLAQFGDDLADEQGDAPEEPGEGVALLLARGAGRDDVAARFVLIHPECTFRVSACADAQGGQESNLQPAVLETAALPIELPP
ncbi:unnamed protein product, partial [Penicillium discolor]